MKNTKIFFGLLVLAAAVLAFGCNQANKPAGSDDTKAAAAQAAYNSLITGFTGQAMEMPVEAVKTTLVYSNDALKAAQTGYMIKDTDADKPIAANSTKEQLEKRFKLEKI